jgi:hypothetical protein
MKQIIISSETPETKALEKAGDKSAIAAVNLILYTVMSFSFLSSLFTFVLIRGN